MKHGLLIVLAFGVAVHGFGGMIAPWATALEFLATHVDWKAIAEIIAACTIVAVFFVSIEYLRERGRRS